MSKTLELTQGQVATVDDADYEWASQWKWTALRRGKTDKYYAVRGEGPRGHQKFLYLHRELLGAPPGMEVDHINGEGLDCRRENMRLATKTENGRNRAKYATNTSGFKGVSWDEQRGKWVAYIRVNGRAIFLGRYDEGEEAAQAYDDAALSNFGVFARLNYAR